MAVGSVHTFRIRPGRLQEFLGLAAEAKKIHEQLGGRVRIWQQAFGPESATIAYVVEHDDMSAYGAFTDKLQSDSSWQALVQRVSSSTDPTVEPVSAALFTELPQ